MDLQDVFVVVPAFNEAPVLPVVLADLGRYLPAGRIVVVDDASTDATAPVARAAGARVLRHAINRGQGAALATGLQAALRLGAGVIVTFDADGQHSADDLPALVAPLRQGRAQVVLGTRFAGGSATQMPLLRRCTLRAAVCFTRVFSRLPVTDTHNGFRAFSAEAAGRITLRQDRMAHASEILDEIRRLGLSYVECPVRIHYSTYSLAKGQSNGAALRLGLRILLDKVFR